MASGAPPADVDDIQPSGPEPGWKAVLVWRRDLTSGDSEPGFTTAWLERSGDGAREVATREETVIATSRGLAAIRERDVPVKVCATCGTCDLKTHRGCKDDASVEREWDLVDLATNKTAIILGRDKPLDARFQGCAGDLQGLETHASFHAALALVSVTSWGAMISCDGVQSGAQDRTFDAETLTDARIDLGAADLKRLGDLAKKQFLEDHSADCPIDTTDTPTIASVTFFYNAQGRLIGDYTFSVRNEHACQRPLMVTSEVEIKDAVLPPIVASAKRLPRWLSTYVRDHKIEDVSAIPSGQDLDALKKVFASPVPGSKKAAPAKPQAGKKR